MKTTTNNKGFTLIEIMIVLVLLGLVASMVIRKINPNKGKIQATKIQIKQIEAALDRYKLDCNFYPTDDQGGLKALVAKPSSGRGCPQYDPEGYMDGKKKLPQDPWGVDYQYSCADGQNYVVKSFGPDGVEGGEGQDADLSSEEEN
jgi:general secretion pathway protein G